MYDHPEPEPGAVRFFVDRLWPRGVRKDDFHYDDWAKDLAPSTELRRWYSHDAAHFREFRARYRDQAGAPLQIGVMRGGELVALGARVELAERYEPRVEALPGASEKARRIRSGIFRGNTGR